MLFNSIAFLAFFPLVVLCYWLLPNKWRNRFLLVASYYFYMCWSAKYALLILFSSVTTWFVGRKIEDSPQHRKTWMTTCIVINFAILFVFKYLNFASESAVTLLNSIGVGTFSFKPFDILLPVGISFYTFQAIGYMIDVWRGTIKAERGLFTYLLFVSFFPQLVAGPIERAKNMLPQFHYEHKFSSSLLIRGFKLMAWGYFLKMCVAQNVSPYVDAVFNNIHMHNGNSILLASFFFTFQIFSDFGGYSLIAIGTAKCMGYDLMQNFQQPYLATSIREFWRSWHISLTSWFTDYVYIPLGGSRCSYLKHKRNLFITFLVSGVWHGANWTFVAWGAYHGLLIVIHSIFKNINLMGNHFLRCRQIINIVIVFFLALGGWILFRANTLHDAVTAYVKIATERGMLFNGAGKPAIAMGLIMIFLLMAKEMRDKYNWKYAIRNDHISFTTDILKVVAVVCLIMLCANFESGQFIYFQF
jgi:D-alanyl-lipoteichoic acid acyltransferase DltB (MBOAT superfamily)